MTAIVYARTPVRLHRLTRMCWCRPIWDVDVWVHRFCELRPDVQPRMAVYSS